MLHLVLLLRCLFITTLLTFSTAPPPPYPTSCELSISPGLAPDGSQLTATAPGSPVTLGIRVAFLHRETATCAAATDGCYAPPDELPMTHMSLCVAMIDEGGMASLQTDNQIQCFALDEATAQPLLHTRVSLRSQYCGVKRISLWVEDVTGRFRCGAVAPHVQVVNMTETRTREGAGGGEPGACGGCRGSEAGGEIDADTDGGDGGPGDADAGGGDADDRSMPPIHADGGGASSDKSSRTGAFASEHAGPANAPAADELHPPSALLIYSHLRRTGGTVLEDQLLRPALQHAGRKHPSSDRSPNASAPPPGIPASPSAALEAAEGELALFYRMGAGQRAHYGRYLADAALVCVGVGLGGGR